MTVTTDICPRITTTTTTTTTTTAAAASNQSTIIEIVDSCQGGYHQGTKRYFLADGSEKNVPQDYQITVLLPITEQIGKSRKNGGEKGEGKGEEKEGKFFFRNNKSRKVEEEDHSIDEPTLREENSKNLQYQNKIIFYMEDNLFSN